MWVIIEILLITGVARVLGYMVPLLICAGIALIIVLCRDKP